MMKKPICFLLTLCFFLLAGSHHSYAYKAASLKVSSSLSQKAPSNQFKPEHASSSYKTSKETEILEFCDDVMEEKDDDETSYLKKIAFTCNYYIDALDSYTSDYFHSYLAKHLEQNNHSLSPTNRHILLCVIRI
jgi:hypothetical protein